MGKLCDLCGQPKPIDSLAWRLKNLRMINKLSLRTLGENVKTSANTILRGESGKMIKLNTIIKLSSYFNVSLDYLVHGDIKKKVQW